MIGAIGSSYNSPICLCLVERRVCPGWGEKHRIVGVTWRRRIKQTMWIPSERFNSSDFRDDGTNPDGVGVSERRKTLWWAGGGCGGRKKQKVGDGCVVRNGNSQLRRCELNSSMPVYAQANGWPSQKQNKHDELYYV